MFKKKLELMKRGLCIALAGAMILCSDATGFASQLPQNTKTAEESVGESKETNDTQGQDTEPAPETEEITGTEKSSESAAGAEPETGAEDPGSTETIDVTETSEPTESTEATEPIEPAESTEDLEPTETTEIIDPAGPAEETETVESTEEIEDEGSIKGDPLNAGRIEITEPVDYAVTDIGQILYLPKYKVYDKDGQLIADADISDKVQWVNDDMGTVDLTAQGSVVTARRAGVAYLKLQMRNDPSVYASYRIIVRPEAPGKASVISSNYNSARLKWDKSADAFGYVIYRKTAEDEEYIEIAKLKGAEAAEYLDEGTLSTGTRYGYRIKSYVSYTDENNLVQYAQSSGHAVLQVTPELGKTELVKLSTSAYNSATLTWNSLEGADGYSIYRAAGSSAKYQEVKSVGGGTNSYTDKSLKSGQNYSYKVCAYRNVNGNKVYGIESDIRSIKPIPSVPELTVKAQDYKSVKLSWKKVTGASGYGIYRTEDGKDSFKKIKSVTSGSAESYVDKSVKTGTKYSYKVRAYKKVDGNTVWGGYSKEKTVTATMTAPKISLSNGTYNSITVNWKNVSGAEGFTILRSDSANGKYTAIKTIRNTKTLSLKDTRLKTGKTYYYKVRAYRKVDGKNVNGTLSGAISQRIVPGSVKVTAAAAGATAIKLTWSKTELPSSNSGYLIYQVTAAGDVKIKSCNSKTTSYTLKNLTSGSKYTYKVVAYVKDKTNGTVTGSDSNHLAVSPELLPVTIKSVEPSNYSSLKVVWQPTKSAEEDGYIIYRSTKKDSGYKNIKTVKKSSGKSEYSYTDKGLTVGKAYFYKIVCTKQLSNGKTIKSAYSGGKSAKAAPQAPTVKLSTHQYNSIKVTWNKLKGTSASGYVDGYVIYRSTKKDGTYKKVKTITNGKTASYTDSGLKVGETYYYKVRGYSMVKKSRVYGTYSKVVSKKVVPGKVSIKAESASYNSVLVSWKNVKGSDGYRVYRAGSEAGKYIQVANVSSNKLSYKDAKLTTGSTYFYKVRAYCNKNGKKIYGAYSDIKQAIPVLGTPKNLRAFGADNNQIKLTWDAVAGADTYTILRSTSEYGTYKIASEICDTNSFLDSNAKVGQTYYYKVYAVRGGASGGTSDCVTAIASSMELNITEAVIKRGTNIRVTATVNPAAPVSWSSDNTAIALAGSDGTIYGIKAGKTTVRATSNGITKTVSVTVKNQLDGKGIDVSSANGQIDFNAVRAAGYEYAMIRITTGTTPDSSFETNYTNAKAAGLKVGVYCYAMAVNTAGAQAEADKVLSILKGRSLDYPIVYHMEDSKQIYGLSNTDRTNLMLTFKNRIAYLNSQYKFALYATLGWLNNNFDNRSLAGIDIWVALYRDKKLGHGYKGAGNVVMWQYTNQGSVKGVSGDTGINIRYKAY